MRLPRLRHRPGADPVRPVWPGQLQAAAALISDRGNGGGPPVIDGHPAVAFLGGTDAALRYLHGRWVTYLGVATEEQLDEGPGSVLDAARRAWDQVCCDQPGLARILFWYRDEPAVRAADEGHRRLLAELVPDVGPCLPGFHRADAQESSRSLASRG